AEALGARPELALVVLRSVEREHDAVRQLEDAVHGLARRRLGPPERAEELGHPLDVATGERDEVELRREHGRLGTLNRAKVGSQAPRAGFGSSVACDVRTSARKPGEMSWWLILLPALGVGLIALAVAVRAGRSRSFY